MAESSRPFMLDAMVLHTCINQNSRSFDHYAWIGWFSERLEDISFLLVHENSPINKTFCTLIQTKYLNAHQGLEFKEVSLLPLA